MKGNLAQREPEMLKRWQELDIYQHIREVCADRKKKFILHDGPPYANGDIHIGHAVNKILKDIIVKSKTLSGYDVPFIPGWDCHGLPIEVMVEKKKGKPGHKISEKDFRQACREYAKKQVDRQREDFIRLGVFADWQNPYLTMNFQVEADTVRALGKVIANGHLEKGFKPVYWSVASGSALAEAEVEYKDKTSYAIDVKFTPVDQPAFKKKFADTAENTTAHIVIWTTTPWTLPANQAVSLHPEFEYSLLEVTRDDSKEHLLLASDLIASCLERYAIDEYKVIGTCIGQDLEHIQLRHPFYDKQVPIILGEHVTTEAGTGAVHTAPDHGVDDFIVGKKYQLGTINIVNDNGVYRDSVEIFAGQHVHKVDTSIIEKLEDNSNLVHQHQITHSFPHCWRTKTPLIFRATPQWFISMNKNNLLQRSLEEVENVEWLPDWGKARIISMLSNSPDWCVSRQRTWGVPITLFVNSESQELHPDTVTLIEEVAQRIEKEGIQAWYDLEPSDLLGAEAKDYTKVTDTLDVWFDSGVTHESVVHRQPQLNFPADLYLEGSDQHRGWFQSSLKTSVAINNRAPYKTVLTHGFTVDASGRKMSKSLGNVVAPQKIFKSLGADILRLWVASSDFSSEMNVSDEILKRTADSYRRMRNTVRYLLSNLHGFDPSKDLVAANEMIALDRWAVNRVAVLQKQAIDHYEKYEFHQLYQALHNFCSFDLGSLYLDIIKDRVYTTQSDSLARKSAQTATYHIAHSLLRLLAPILNFTAEEAFSHIPENQETTIFTKTWYQDLAELSNDEYLNADTWDLIFDVRQLVLKTLEEYRAKGDIGSGLDADVVIYCENDTNKALSLLEDELRFVLITSTATMKSLTDSPSDLEKSALSNGENIKIAIQKSKNDKCVRCWHLREDVGSHKDHPELCMRCVDNVDGSGEIRKYA
ncbi:MAG: isoleucine--tRNA ligase [Gammaproteobacteria bacterium]|nr:isoleucine--tRNA ligase [Gammaproteobacteria bacterium]